eukprot:jgi/Mesvir1/21316/Mv25587-RA.1
MGWGTGEKVRTREKAITRQGAVPQGPCGGQCLKDRAPPSRDGGLERHSSATGCALSVFTVTHPWARTVKSHPKRQAARCGSAHGPGRRSLLAAVLQRACGVFGAPFALRF